MEPTTTTRMRVGQATSEGSGFYKSGSGGTQASGGVPYTTTYNYNKGTSNTKYKN